MKPSFVLYHKSFSAVPMSSTSSSSRPSAPVINIPVSKEQYSIIESNKSKEPKTILEALKKFNEDRKRGDLVAGLPMPNLSAFPGPSQPFNAYPTSSFSESFTKLVPSLLKKPVNPLAAPPKSNKSIPVITFKKPVSVLKPKVLPPSNSSTPQRPSGSIVLPKPLSLTSPPVLPKVSPMGRVVIPPSQNPSISIQIKETSNALLDSLLAGSKPSKSDDSFEAMDTSDGPPTLTSYSKQPATNDCLRIAFEEFKRTLVGYIFLTSIEQFLYTSDSESSSFSEV